MKINIGTLLAMIATPGIVNGCGKCNDWVGSLIKYDWGGKYQ